MTNNLSYLINHIFFPPKLPESNDFTHDHEHELCRSVFTAGQAYRAHLHPDETPLWNPVIKMLNNLCILYRKEDSFTQEKLSQIMTAMKIGDVTALLIREQNAGLIIRKYDDRTVFESFEVSAPNEEVMGHVGKLICSYPGPAIAIPSDAVSDPNFISAISSFLYQMHASAIDAAIPTARKAGTNVEEIRNTPHPRFISDLLTGILRGYGYPEDVQRITKRIADDVLWDRTLLPWRRSPMWLVIRIALQTTLKDSVSTYKSFMAFLMTRILRAAVKADLDGDTLAIMYKKLARRVYKIRQTAPEFVQSQALEVVDLARGLLQKRWDTVQETHASEGMEEWDPLSLNIPDDTELSLDNSRDYITNALSSERGEQANSPFEPKEHWRVKALDGYSTGVLGKQLRMLGVLALFDFERAVEMGFDDWIHRGTSKDGCVLIWEWMEQYSADAARLYEHHPEQKSIMFLTLLELWIGLDKLAVRQHPLLRKYSPELQESLFEPLLLHRRQSIRRLEQAIRYLRDRHADADHSLPSIFSPTISRYSFAVRYFETHPDLHGLKTRIEERATEDRQAKERELKVQKDLYDERFRRAASQNHADRYNSGTGTHTHRKKRCPKCKLEKVYNAMVISVHEWPLPPDPNEAKAVVFEIDCPPVFGLWRQATYFFLRDMCYPSSLRNETKSPDAEATLADYAGLASFRVQSGFRRLTFASTTKSWTKSHYNGVKVSAATADRVCLQNALHLALFDTTDRVWITEPFRACTIRAECTYQLPHGRYHNLQYAVDTTLHTTNEVHAAQSDCHQDLGLHEYIAFGSLRAGGRIQWLNVLRELRARTLTFSEEAVEMLIIQAVLQMGPLIPDGRRWEWHEVLEDDAFHHQLLEELETLHNGIQANWSEVVTMRIILLLVQRVLNWCCNPNVVRRALTLLQKACGVTYDWMGKLEHKLQTASGENSLAIQLQLWEMAATVRSAFNSTPDLLASPSLNILFKAGMVFRDNIPATSHLVNVLKERTDRLIVQDHRFAHTVEPSLLEMVTRRSGLLHHAVSQYWSTYQSGSAWMCCASPNDRWLCSMSSDGQRVFFNVLESQLMVNGKPLSRLPSAYISHPTYTRLFGKTVFDVIPPGNSEPKAEFATRDPIHGYQIFFALSIAGSLVIRAKSVKTCRHFQLIPHTLFEGDLPRTMVEDFTHWLSLDDGVIELRPLADIWTSSANWRIDFLDRHMRKGTSTERVRLIDVRSRTAQMITSRLNRLEQRGFIIVTYSSISGTTLVELPRYRLLFQLNTHGELVCLTLPNMVVDDNQSAGTMIGLQNRLVLRDSTSHDRRELLVPVGDISFEPIAFHTQVCINPAETTSDRRVHYFRYTIDETLGRLVGTSSSLHARLYRIYLTALTSHLLPDPLTGRTGTEEALKELRSAACKSFISLDGASRDLLHKITQITPRREYYPRHLEVMQTVKWSALPALAQHNEFFRDCQSILEFAVRLEVFSDTHGEKEVTQTLEHGSAVMLVDRAANRSMWYYPHEFHKEQPRDREYRSRGVPDVTCESLVYSTSTLIRHWPSNLPTTKALLSDLKGLSNGEVGGLTNSGNATLDVRYLTNSPLSDTWINLYDILRAQTTSNHQVAFTLCLIAYAYRDSSKVQRLIPTLIAFAARREKFCSQTYHPPIWNSYRLIEGFEPNSYRLQQIARDSLKGFQPEDYQDIPRLPGETDSSLRTRRKRQYDERKENEIKQIVDFVVRQWPSPELRSRELPHVTIVRSTQFINNVKPLLTHWYHNHELKVHLALVQSSLDVIHGQARSVVVPPEDAMYLFTPSLQPGTRPSSSISLRDIMKRPPPDIGDLPALALPLVSVSGCHLEARQALTRMDDLVGELGCSNDPIRRSYVADINRSLDALKDSQAAEERQYDQSDFGILSENQRMCDSHLERSLRMVQESLWSSFSVGNAGEKLMMEAGLWPCLYLRPVLESIASSNVSKPSNQWIRALKDLARSLLLSQRAHRLLRHAQVRNIDDLYKELNVDEAVLKVDDCDWLLIQANSDFLVRKVQLSVAQEMISPSSSKNTVLQLNMGEGKSSVIVPFLGTALADGQHLMRVVVLKSLARQMFSLLVQRLGGLTNRQVLFLPFSRDVNVDQSEVMKMRKAYEDARKAGAVLVAQPEHILSFKLMGVNQLVEQTNNASQLAQTQQWLDSVTRDVLDESDEILHTRYQLTYTVGHQQILEHGSDRWSTIQQILSLVAKGAGDTRGLFPSGIEVVASGNGFPHIRILQPNAGTNLISRVVEMVLSGELSTCYLERFTDRTRQVLKRFITGGPLSLAEKTTLVVHCGDKTLWKTLLLLRGLLGQGILIYVLQARRWRVDFGLDPSRSLLAVPYRAKDVPSLRAEFGHPDVAILLTCLSYLYGGLSPANLNTCLDLLLKLDNPRLEYEEWVHYAPHIPDGLRDLNGVNVRDTEQRERLLFPLFRLNPATINFYLSRVVFPKAAKEFPEKLATTGWDIACNKKHVTTGFSGTNDNRYLLPTSIIQVDTPDRLDTNARMLNLLMSPENNWYLAPSTQALSGQDIINALVGVTGRADVRVLLDVGAQIIEMNNAQVAAYWLERRSDASAAVFFNEKDELEVMTRDGTTESLALSPFHGHLDECLVYLDDAHTRGTDLKLPTHWKACVTLGPKVTKDRLAQGCMRMRKLGRGQSIMFMAPPDIDGAIRKHAQKTSVEEVDSRDVVRWAMLETCAEIRHHIPHWVQQGVDYADRNDGWKQLDQFEDLSRASAIVKRSWLQPEARTLEQMYGILSTESEEFQSLTRTAKGNPDIWRRCEMLGVVSLGDPRVGEEQEREVNHEVEREPQIQRPPKAEPAIHTLHPSVTAFIQSGVITNTSRKKSLFVSAFVPLGDGARASDVRRWQPRPGLQPLLATKDFLTTIESTASTPVGDYLRPLNWIVSSRHTSCLVVLSPHEVNELLPKIRKSKNVTLHIYTPCLTQFMKPTDDLRFYHIPSNPNPNPPSPLMIIQLNLCAGQLYFSDYEEYRRVTGFLGICIKEDRDCQAEIDGFAKPENRGPFSRLSVECQFNTSPVSYLKLLTGSRRKGLTYDPTHLGKALNMRYLVDSNF